MKDLDKSVLLDVLAESDAKLRELRDVLRAVSDSAIASEELDLVQRIWSTQNAALTLRIRTEKLKEFIDD